MSAGRIAIELVRWSIAWWLLWHIPRPSAATSPDAGASRSDGSQRLVSVVVPARNEAANLARLLPSLAGSRGRCQVVVVDNHSTDGTADVARDAGVTVVGAPPLPAGWAGKPWACATGAQATGGERLVFLDADVVVEPGGLDRVLGEHDRLGGLVSVQPFHVTERPYEWLSAYFNVVGLMGVDAFTPLGRRVTPTGAFGPCLVLDRSLYDAAGGHAAVRGEVLDDVAMARRVQSAGGRVTLFGGRGSLRFRMYPQGLASLVEGWTKNFAGGAAGTRPLTMVLVVLWLSGGITAAWDVPRTAVEGTTAMAATAAGVYGAYAVQLWLLLRRVGRFGRFGVTVAALFFVPLAFFLGVFLRSVVLTFVRREVRWRGRTIPTRS